MNTVSSDLEDLRLLPSFLAVAEERHFGRAAKRLNVAQPTLSQRIGALECELGVALFDRTRRPIGLTPAGSAFLEEARVAVHHAGRAVERGRRAARGELGHLSVAAISWANNALLAPVLRAFRERAPDVSVDISTSSPTGQIEALQQERLDLGFTAFAEWLAGGRALNIEPVLEEPLVAMVAHDHPFAKRAEISLEELAAERFVTLSHSIAPGLIGRQMAIFHERGLFPAEVQGAPDPWALLVLIAAGVGVGLHMASFSNVHYRGVVFIPLAGEAPTSTLFMLWRSDDDRELVRLFVETARDVGRSLEPPEVFRSPTR